MKNSITVSAPGKLMLLGEHAVVYGHPCIVTAVDQRLYLTAELTDKPFFELNAPDVGIKNYKKPISKLGQGNIPKGAQFIELAAKLTTRSNLVVQQGSTLFKGIRITTSSDFSSQYGFGSSSASTVCTIFALSKLLNTNLTHKQLFDLAYKTVLKIQGKASGFDIAAAIYGGTIYFRTGGKAIRPTIPPSPAARSARSAWHSISRNPTIPLIVAYSGTKADTATLIQKVAHLAQKYPQIVQKTYDLVENVVENGKNAIKNGDFQKLGELFNINQGYLESLGVSTTKLSAMIYAAREAGAYGAKLSGGGGGDCVITVAPPNKKLAVEKAIESASGRIIKVETNAQGARLEK